MAKDKRPFKIQKKRAGDVKRNNNTGSSGGPVRKKRRLGEKQEGHRWRVGSEDSADEVEHSKAARPEEKVQRHGEWTLPFQAHHRILLVGEGACFTFFPCSLSILLSFDPHIHTFHRCLF